MKKRRLCFLLFMVMMLSIGNQCKSMSENVSGLQSDVDFRCLNRKDYKHPLLTYASPSTKSNEICSLPNGSLVRCLERINEDWWLLEIPKGNDGITAYAMVEAEELVSIIDTPPAHPIYREALLELEGGFAYRFGSKAPAQLLDALERAEVDFDSVYCGSISSINSKIAVMIVEIGQEKALCLLSELQDVWTLIGINRNIYHKNSMPLSYFEFTMDGKLAFHLTWLGVPGVRCLLSTEEDSFSQRWRFECIVLYGGDNRLSRNVQIIPMSSNLVINGSINAKSIITEVNESVPCHDYRFFENMNCLEVERLVKTYFPEFFMLTSNAGQISSENSFPLSIR